LRQQTDAKGQVMTLAYDVLGRATQRTELEGTTSFYFDAASKPKGSVDRIEAPGVNQYFFYDSLARPNKTTTQVTGSGAGNGSYDVTTGFDAHCPRSEPISGSPCGRTPALENTAVEPVPQ
jgi:YD repeat-containing protein